MEVATHVKEEPSIRWEVRVKLVNRTGLHSRPVGAFTRVAKESRSTITVRCGGKEADGKKMLELIGLDAHQGATLDIVATGPDAVEATEKLKQLIENKFGEPE